MNNKLVIGIFAVAGIVALLAACRQSEDLSSEIGGTVIDDNHGAGMPQGLQHHAADEEFFVVSWDDG